MHSSNKGLPANLLAAYKTKLNNAGYDYRKKWKLQQYKSLTSQNGNSYVETISFFIYKINLWSTAKV